MITSKDTRLTFFEPTNFKLPIAVFNTLVEDAFYFDYVKNEQANLSGLLNRLIPNLSEYRTDLHSAFLKANGGDENLTYKIEECIYKIYFNKYDYCDDGVVSVPFRANNEHLQRLLNIADSVIYSLNMDFTGYVRSLLVEYSSKRLNQREYFFYYNEINEIKNATYSHLMCHFYLKTDKITFIPVSVELSRRNECNLIVGYNPEISRAFILPLSNIKRIVTTEFSYSITDEDCNFVYNALREYEEQQEEQ